MSMVSHVVGQYCGWNLAPMSSNAAFSSTVNTMNSSGSWEAFPDLCILILLNLLNLLLRSSSDNTHVVFMPARRHSWNLKNKEI